MLCLSDSDLIAAVLPWCTLLTKTFSKMSSEQSRTDNLKLEGASKQGKEEAT
jgi:hypothetical protein